MFYDGDIVDDLLAILHTSSDDDLLGSNIFIVIS